MASAGRILILPRGIYDPTKEYEMLDLVFNGGTSWLAKKSSVGVEPSDANTEYWFKMCEATDLSTVNERLQQLESQMISTISLDDIDLSGYATKSELNNYATKTEMNSINTSLGGRLDVVEPKVTTLVSDVNTAKTNISNLQANLNNMSASSKVEIKSYDGSGKSGASNPCSVTFSFVPKMVMMLGWTQGENKHQISINGMGYDYCHNFILCDLLTTSFSSLAGFIYYGSATDIPDRYSKKSDDGKTISWYVNTSDAGTQLNKSGNTYYLLAIG